MNLLKAIEILGDTCWDYIPEDKTDIKDAIKLGIEALKEIQMHRSTGYPRLCFVLPGED